MKKQYLTSRRGLAYLVSVGWVSVALGVTTYGRENIVLATLTALALFTALTLLGYALFIIEVRTNRLMKSDRSSTRREPPGLTEAHVPTTHTPRTAPAATGRAAALPVTADGDPHVLWGFLRRREDDSVPVAGVLDTTDFPDLAVDVLVPGYATAQLEEGSYRALVIDRTSFHHGPWRGTESAAAMDLADHVMDIIQQARRSGVPVFMVDSKNTPDVNTSRLKSSVDVLFPVESSLYPPEGAPTSTLVTSLQRLGLERLHKESVLD